MKTLDEFLTQDWPNGEAAFAALVSDTGLATVGQQHINKIRRGRRRASPALAIRIEEVTGGAVTRASLRPDLWGQASVPANAIGMFRAKQGAA